VNDSRFVLVTGATGQQGGSVARALLERGHRVRALTRDASSEAARRLGELGVVDVVEGDFTDPDSLARAVEGVDTVYSVTTPFEAGMQAETAQGAAMADAAVVGRVGHLVLSSVAGADQATGVPHFDSKYAVERYVEASGIPFTIVAPVYFMDNLLRPANLSDLREGRLTMPLPPSRSLQQIAVTDIGAFVAAIVERREEVFGARFDIAGDELDGVETASVLSEVTGIEIRYESTPLEALRASSEEMALMYEWFDRVGYSSDIHALRGEFSEVDWHGFRRWAQSQKWELD
jgi:uncharacterized protein YbjT (DUF2867 family)